MMEIATADHGSVPAFKEPSSVQTMRRLPSRRPRLVRCEERHHALWLPSGRSLRPSTSRVISAVKASAISYLQRLGAIGKQDTFFERFAFAG